MERELDLEVRTYAEMLAADKIGAGMNGAEARREAMLELGGVEQVKEQVREVRIGNLLENLWQDLRYGCRMLARNPGFTAVAVVSLALGIGGNSAMFSIVNGVLLQPLPYPQPDRLVRVTGYYPKGALQVLQQESRTMDIAGYLAGSELNLTGQGEAVHLVGSTVSANLFTLLGAQAGLGRTFQPGEDVPGPDRMVILSHALWQKKFASDPAIIGHVITIDGVNREVVGVMPASFSFPSFETQLWIPLRMDPRDAEGFWGKDYHALDREAASWRGDCTGAKRIAATHCAGDHPVSVSDGAILECGRGDCPIAGGHGTRCPAQAALVVVRGGIRAADCMRERGQSLAFAFGGSRKRNCVESITGGFARPTPAAAFD